MIGVGLTGVGVVDPFFALLSMVLFGAITGAGDSSVDFEVPNSLLYSELHETYMKRVAEGRDLRVIISADNAETGVGKTTLGVCLAKLWDIWGWDAAKKATLDPREYTVRYDGLRKVSVQYLLEAEQALEKRRAMSDEIVAVGHDFATKRYRQLIGILDLPSKSMMDARIADTLCDYWILVRERGHAVVFEFDENQFTGKTYYKKVEEISWPPLDGDPDYEAVERMKVEWMTDQTQSRYVTREEFQEAKKNFWRKAELKATYNHAQAAYEVSQDEDSDFSATQAEIGRIVGLSQPRVSDIVNADSFDDVYSSFKDSADVEIAG